MQLFDVNKIDSKNGKDKPKNSFYFNIVDRTTTSLQLRSPYDFFEIERSHFLVMSTWTLTHPILGKIYELMSEKLHLFGPTGAFKIRLNK